MGFRINQPVVTPIGEGVYQGVITIQDPDSVECRDITVLVRVNLTEQSTPHLRDANCLTPYASESGLWTFKESDLQ